MDWVISEVIDRTRTAAAARRIEVTVEAERGLTVYGSDNQLATAVANLVENALNYSGEDTTVRIAARTAGEQVEIAVTDQGIGIAPTDVDRIFERFYRADQARRERPAAPASGWRSSSTSRATMAAGWRWRALLVVGRRSLSGCPPVRRTTCWRHCHLLGSRPVRPSSGRSEPHLDQAGRPPGPTDERKRR